MGLNLSESKKLYEYAKNIIAGGVNSPVRAFRHVGGSPIYFNNAHGSRVVDVDGNEFVDFCQSWGPLILGHSHSKVVKSVQRAAEKGLSYGACHEREIEISELILSAFDSFEMVRLMNSGTEAVMTALRLARGITGRDLVLKFEGGYHGHFDGMLVKAGSGLATYGIANSDGIPVSIAKTTLVAQFNDQESVLNLFREYGDNIAAIIIEPLPANNGLLVQKKDFLQFLRDISRQYGTLLIFDEVISGFRLHYGGYFQIINIVPDLIVLGKIIGGGMPVGAVVGSKSYLNHLSPVGNVYQAGTLSGNPVSMTAGIETLKILKNEQPYEKLKSLATAFADILQNSKISYAKVIYEGSILWLYLDEGGNPGRPDEISNNAVKRYKAVYWLLLESGFYLPPSSLEVMFLSTAHSMKEVERFAASLIEHLQSIA